MAKRQAVAATGSAVATIPAVRTFKVPFLPQGSHSLCTSVASEIEAVQSQEVNILAIHTYPIREYRPKLCKFLFVKQITNIHSKNRRRKRIPLTTFPVADLISRTEIRTILR